MSPATTQLGNKHLETRVAAMVPRTDGKSKRDLGAGSSSGDLANPHGDSKERMYNVVWPV